MKRRVWSHTASDGERVLLVTAAKRKLGSGSGGGTIGEAVTIGGDGGDRNNNAGEIATAAALAAESESVAGFGGVIAGTVAESPTAASTLPASTLLPPGVLFEPASSSSSSSSSAAGAPHSSGSSARWAATGTAAAGGALDSAAAARVVAATAARVASLMHHQRHGLPSSLLATNQGAQSAAAGTAGGVDSISAVPSFPPPLAATSSVSMSSGAAASTTVSAQSGSVGLAGRGPVASGALVSHLRASLTDTVDVSPLLTAQISAAPLRLAIPPTPHVFLVVHAGVALGGVATALAHRPAGALESATELSARYTALARGVRVGSLAAGYGVEAAVARLHALLRLGHGVLAVIGDGRVSLVRGLRIGGIDRDGRDEHVLPDPA